MTPTQTRAANLHARLAGLIRTGPNTWTAPGQSPDAKRAAELTGDFRRNAATKNHAGTSVVVSANRPEAVG